MVKKVLLPVVLLLLVYGFWISPEFKEISAGVALFLFGMLSLEEGFRAFTGGTLETLLKKSTSAHWRSLSFGVIATTLMQSSTLVSLVTISFVSAEMMTLASGIVVVIGANLGSSTGAWLIAGLGLKADIASYAMPMLVFGVIFTLQKSKTLKGLGYVILGIGFLFLGIHFMKTGFEAFQDSFDLSSYAVGGLSGVFLFVLIGTAMTAIMQSSHATLLVIIAALAVGQVTYENAMALAIGANLGSGVTTGIAGLAANLGGKRLAIANVIFNLAKTAVAIAFMDQLAWLVEYLAPLMWISDDNYLLKLALFNTLFNLLMVILTMPFISQIERMLVKYITFSAKVSEQPLYLFPEALEIPATAVSAVRKEVQHLFDNAYGLLAHGISVRRVVIDSDESLSDAIKNTRRIMPLDLDDIYEDKIKSLHSAIVAFIGEAQTKELTREAGEELFMLRQASRNIVEAVKAMKHMHKNLSRYGISNQLAIREHYDAMRLQVATLLRELRDILKNPEEATSLSLDAVRVGLERSGHKLIENLDELIRTRRIQPAVATSIMNDEAYVNELGAKLINATRSLLVAQAQYSVERLTLDKEEIEKLAKASSAG